MRRLSRTQKKGGFQFPEATFLDWLIVATY
jgi:hypothetical protein